MTRLQSAVTVAAMCFFIVASSNAQLPAFPGAEGFGTEARGGRGGTVIEVTNLNPSGPGSFKNAVTSSGPRIVIFKVGGVIEQNELIPIKDPYLTVAGQTAPGDGIVFRGMLSIQTYEVIIRGMRFRLGDDLRGIFPDKMKGIEIWPGRNATSDAYSVVIDHCSFSWGVDESGIGVGTSSSRYGSHDVTLSWNIFAEGLYNSLHSKGPHSMGATFNSTAWGNMTAHHNLIAHCNHRTPNVNGLHGELINNVVYNYMYQGSNIDADNGANVIGCYYKEGPNTPRGKRGITVTKPAHVRDNIGPGRENGIGNDWLAVTGPVSLSRANPFPHSDVTATSPATAYDDVLSGAGALPRDPVDERVVNDVYAGTGRLIDSQNEVGGVPSYNPGVAPLDSDHDGMPDAWEISYGFDPFDGSDGRGDYNGDGYTNIEDYINSFFVPLEVTDAPKAGSGVPDGYTLLQNYPNPFNPSTTIEYSLPEDSHVRLTVYDMLGREVAKLVDSDQNAGVQAVVFDARGLSSGTYLYRLAAGGQFETGKMQLMK